jgi:hypothetical protein
MSRCNSIISNLWQSVCRNPSAGSNKSPGNLACKKARWLNLVFTAMIAITIAACGAGGGGCGGGSSAGGLSGSTDFVVSGTVSAPGGIVAFVPRMNLFAKFADVLFSPAYAAISGLASVPDGTQVDLVRIDKTGMVISVLATTKTVGGSYSFNLTKLNLTTASDLVVQVTSLSTGVKMRAFVGADGAVNIDPTSETSVRIVLAKIAAIPSLSLSNFTTLELTDITAAINLLITTQQLSGSIDIETTVSIFKAAVSANTGVVAFVNAASASGQSSEGPGDIGNYFPFSQGDTWSFSGSISESGLPNVSFNNIVAFTGSRTLNGVSVAVLNESNPGNAGADELYLTKGSSGITNYGNNDAQDFFTQQLIPYREIKFPLKIGSTFEQLNKSGLNWPDSDHDGHSETAKAVSLVTIAGFEDVTVTAGNFSNCVKVVTALTVTITFSSDGSKAELIETDTSWYAPGVGSVKNTSVVEVTGQGVVSTETEQLTAYIVGGQASVVSVQVAPATVSIGFGEVQQFTATARDLFNNPISGVTFSWVSSNPAAATINTASGLATGVAIGTTYITASTMGFISNSATLNVTAKQIALATNDLIYDSIRKKIYASVPGRAGTLGNTITVIDPETGAIGPSLLIGSDPNKLAISDDTQYLYIGLDAAPKVSRLNLSTQAVDLQFGLGSDAQFGSYYVKDMKVLPGYPGSVAISRKYKDVTGFGGVAVYDQGVQRGSAVLIDPNVGDPIVSVLEFSNMATRLYGYNNETSSFRFYQMSIDANGAHLLDSTENLIQGYYLGIKFDDGLIFVDSGRVIDPVSLTFVDAFTLPSPFSFQHMVQPDTASSRVFFLSTDLSRLMLTLRVYDRYTYKLFSSVDIPGISYGTTVTSFIRCGSNQFAFRTNDGRVYLIRI